MEFPTCRGSKNAILHTLKLGTRQKCLISFTFRLSYLRSQEVDGLQSHSKCCEIELPASSGNCTSTADCPFFGKVTTQSELSRLLLVL